MNVGEAADVAVWTDADVWDVFLDLVERESPLPGLANALRSHEDAFLGVAARVRAEHSFLANRHFRTPAKRGIVNPANIEHLTRLIHYFSQSLVERNVRELVLDCLFYVLKGRCHINLFYRQRLRGYFFALHAIGAVLGYGEYGEFLIVHQGATVGQNHGRYPQLGNGVVVGPHAMILGECRIGDNVWVGARALIIDTDIPDNSIVIGAKPNVTVYPNPRDNRAEWFDMEMLAAAGKPSWGRDSTNARSGGA